jgi:hypothetical protein
MANRQESKDKCNAPLGASGAGLSDRNGPIDPQKKR